MPVTLTAALPPGQDSYLGNIYLGIETYPRRSRTGHGFPAAGAAPPDKRQGLARCAGQAAHDDTGLRSPVPETGAGNASHARTAPRFPVRAHHRPPGYDHITTPDRRLARAGVLLLPNFASSLIADSARVANGVSGAPSRVQIARFWRGPACPSDPRPRLRSDGWARGPSVTMLLRVCAGVGRGAGARSCLAIVLLAVLLT